MILSAEQRVDAEERAFASREEQGLPPTITDPVVVERIAAIFAKADARAA